MGEDLSLPFLTRQMLKFQHGARFEIEVRTTQGKARTYKVTGATREGLFIFEFSEIAGAAPVSNTFALPDIPLWVTIVGDDALGYSNDTYAELYLRINGERVHLLAGGYIGVFSGISRPTI